MIKSILMIVFTLPVIFGHYHRYSITRSPTGMYRSLPTYIVALPESNSIGYFGDTMVSCRTICRIYSLDKVPYAEVSLYKMRKLTPKDCTSGYYFINEELPAGKYTATNNTDVAQSIIIYDESAIYDDNHIKDILYIEPHQKADIDLTEGIIYISNCALN